MDATDGRKLSEAVLNERRRRAVKMLLGGATIAATAKLCEIGERTVWAAAKADESGGWAAVSVCHGHRPKGSGRALTPEHEREVQRLIRTTPKKIFLILDNPPVHPAKVVEQWLGENADKLKIFYLPNYSPELNPDEQLNADLKPRVTAAVPSKTQMPLVNTTSQALRSIQKQTARVERYFLHPDVRYAA
jgi:transposase